MTTDGRASLGKKLVLGILALVLLIVGFIFWPSASQIQAGATIHRARRRKPFPARRQLPRRRAPIY
jgi:hypothetical protein